MPRGEITEKLKKAGAVLVIFIMCAGSTVHADQQFVLAVGESMVIPCLLELWSDQSVSCVISNPEVLMQDGSGRAVIALSEGTSDVYVHMTNPDTDARYTFVVVPSQRREPSEEWTLPEEHASADAAGAGDGASGSDMAGQDAADAAGEGTYAQGGEYRDGIVDPQAEPHTDREPEARLSEDAGTAPQAEARLSEDAGADSRAKPHADREPEARLSEDERTDSRAEPHADREPEPRLSGNDEAGTAEPVPFWEDRGSGGISFKLIEDGFSGRENEEGNNEGTWLAKYRPFAYLKSDGEVVPLFVCASGREVRWKYVDMTLYIEASSTYNGPYRVGAYDSRGNIYYFSS